MMDRALLERQLAELPIAQYAFFATEELEFSARIRTVCETECPRCGLARLPSERWRRAGRAACRIPRGC